MRKLLKRICMRMVAACRAIVEAEAMIYAPQDIHNRPHSGNYDEIC